MGINAEYMGIILLTELGKTPWQLRFSPFSLLPAVSQLRLPLDTDPLLDTIPVVPSATPTGAPRVSLDTEDTMVVTVMVSTRGRLRLPLDMDLPLDTIPVVPSATPPEALRVSLDTEDTMVDMVMVSTRGRLRLPLDTDPLLDTTPVVASATPTGAPRASLPTGDTVDTDTVGITRGLLSLLTMVEPPPMLLSPALTTTMAMV